MAHQGPSVTTKFINDVHVCWCRGRKIVCTLPNAGIANIQKNLHLKKDVTEYFISVKQKHNCLATCIQNYLKLISLF